MLRKKRNDLQRVREARFTLKTTLHFTSVKASKAPPPGCVLLCFQHYGCGDGRELFSKTQDEVPTWSGTEVPLTESSLVIGNAEFLSDQEKGIDLLCRRENIRRLHAVLKYNRRLRGWILASLGGRCRVGSAQKN